MNNNLGVVVESTTLRTNLVHLVAVCLGKVETILAQNLPLLPGLLYMLFVLRCISIQTNND